MFRDKIAWTLVIYQIALKKMILIFSDLFARLGYFSNLLENNNPSVTPTPDKIPQLKANLTDRPQINTKKEKAI